MRDYFLLAEDERIYQKVEPSGLSRRVPLEEFPPISVVDVQNTEPHHYQDWMEKPRFMVSLKMKSIMEKYNRKMQWKKVVLVDKEQSLQNEYFIMEIPEIDCLSDQTEFYQNGTVKKLVLDRNKAKGHHIFGISGVLEPFVVVSLDVAESFLRRYLTGFAFKKIERM